MCYTSRVTPNQINIANLRDFSAHGLQYRRKGLTGMVNTVWCPWRYLPGAIDWIMAFGGHLFTEKEEDYGHCFAFCKGFYGLSDREAAKAAGTISRLVDIAPTHLDFDCMLYGKTRESIPATREHRRLATRLAPEFARLAAVLEKASGEATYHQPRLHDIALSARGWERICRYHLAGRKTRLLPDGRQLLKDITNAWNRDRAITPQQSARISHRNENVVMVVQKTV